MGQTMRIAYFSPLAPQRTGTAHYSEDLLPHLSRRVHVDAYTDDHLAANQEVGRIYPLYGYRDLAAQYERYDLLVFQLGSGAEHVPIYDLFLRYGGVVTLHDLELSGLEEAGPARRNDGWGQLREIGRHEGLRPLLRTATDALRRGQWPAPQPARPDVIRLVAQRAAGIAVHSRAARESLQARCPGARIYEVAPGMARPPAIDALEARQALGLPADAFICISVGRLEPQARIHVGMQAFARFLERWPNSLYLIVGDPAPGYPLQELAEALGIAGQVRLPGHVELASLYRYLAAADVGIALGQLRQGEAPVDLLRLMSMAKPAIVSRRQPFSEIPDHCAIPVDEGAGEIGQTVAALWALAGHPPLRLSYGRQAARYVQARHSLSATARQYAELFEELATVQAAERLLLRERAAQ